MCTKIGIQYNKGNIIESSEHEIGNMKHVILTKAVYPHVQSHPRKNNGC